MPLSQMELLLQSSMELLFQSSMELLFQSSMELYIELVLFQCHLLATAFCLGVVGEVRIRGASSRACPPPRGGESEKQRIMQHLPWEHQ